MRLIDADALKAFIGTYDGTTAQVEAVEVQYIDNAPTIDRPQGEWITWEEAGNDIASPNRHECSCCHDSAQVLVNGIELLSDYCPNCGAKMKGGRQ